MKKIFAAFLLSVCSLTVCAAPLQKLTVILDWFPNPDHAPIIVANELGYFKEQGLDVELIGPADPSDPPKLVAANQADIGITYQPEFMEQIDRGLPLICIGTLIDKPLNTVVVLKNSNIHSLADLTGKRIGTSNASGLSGFMLKTMLHHNGLSEQQVEIVNVHYNLIQALLSQKVDAVTGVMRNVEVPVLTSKHQAVTTFFPEANGVPTYSELIFISNANKKMDVRFPRFLIAIKKAVHYLDTHPREGWQLFASRYPESNNAANQQSWFASLPYFAKDPATFDQQAWLRFGTFMQEHQLIKTLQPLSRYTVTLHH